MAVGTHEGLDQAVILMSCYLFLLNLRRIQKAVAPFSWVSSCRCSAEGKEEPPWPSPSVLPVLRSQSIAVCPPDTGRTNLNFRNGAYPGALEARVPEQELVPAIVMILLRPLTGVGTWRASPKHMLQQRCMIIVNHQSMQGRIQS